MKLNINIFLSMNMLSINKCILTLAYQEPHQLSALLHHV